MKATTADTAGPAGRTVVGSSFGTVGTVGPVAAAAGGGGVAGSIERNLSWSWSWSLLETLESPKQLSEVFPHTRPQTSH